MNHGSATVFAIIALASPHQAHVACKWDTDFNNGILGNAHVVDSFNGNLLLRSAWPTQNTKHCIAEAFSKAAGKLWPRGEYDLIDVTLALEIIDKERPVFGNDLINFGSEFWKMEPAFNQECSSETGRNCSSMSMQPIDVPDDIRLRMASHFEHWDVDHLESRMRAVHSLLHRTDGPPKVIFFHCASGKDRTGEFAAAYAMRYLNMSFTEAWQTNVQIARRPLIYELQTNTQWYCEYLRATGLYRHNDDCMKCTTVTAEMLESLLTCTDRPKIPHGRVDQLHGAALTATCQSALERFYTPICNPLLAVRPDQAADPTGPTRLALRTRNPAPIFTSNVAKLCIVACLLLVVLAVLGVRLVKSKLHCQPRQQPLLG